MDVGGVDSYAHTLTSSMLSRFPNNRECLISLFQRSVQPPELPTLQIELIIAQFAAGDNVAIP